MGLTISRGIQGITYLTRDSAPPWQGFTASAMIGFTALLFFVWGLPANCGLQPCPGNITLTNNILRGVGVILALWAVVVFFVTCRKACMDPSPNQQLTGTEDAYTPPTLQQPSYNTTMPIMASNYPMPSTMQPMPSTMQPMQPMQPMQQQQQQQQQQLMQQSESPALAAPSAPAQPTVSIFQVPPSASVNTMSPIPTIDALLTTVRLETFCEKIKAMGVTEVADFTDVADEDLEGCGMKKLEIKRLRRHLRPWMGDK
jgi:hypothetical protein